MGWLYETPPYSIANDTANGVVAYGALREALAAALGSVYDSTVVDHATDTITVRLSTALPSQQQIDDIEAVINAHDGEPLADLAIAPLAGGDHRDHRQINYKSGLLDRLHRYVDYTDPTYWKRGEYRRVEYYLTPARVTKVIDVVIEYARQPNGLLAMINPAAQWGDPDFFGRRTVRTWYRADGTPHPDVKITVKTYDAVESGDEGERRRGNVMKQLQYDVLIMLVYTETAGDVAAAEAIGMAYLAKYENEISNYVATGDQTIAAGVAADTETWLDNGLDNPPFGLPGVTIRDVILDSLQEITAP